MEDGVRDFDIKDNIKTDYCISCDYIKEIYPNEFDLTICFRCYKKYILCDKTVR